MMMHPSSSANVRAWSIVGGRIGLVIILRVLLSPIESSAGIIPLNAVGPPEMGPYQLIRATSATVTDRNGTRPLTENVFNGAGLSSDNPIYASHGSDPGTVWKHSLSDGMPVSLRFDLGGEFLVNEMWIWQLVDDDSFGARIDEFDVIFYNAAGTEVGFLDNGIEKIKATGIQPTPRFAAFGECVFLPVPDCVRFIELRIRSNQGSDQIVGLAEVAFAGRRKTIDVPEPAASLMALLGVMVCSCYWRAVRR